MYTTDLAKKRGNLSPILRDGGAYIIASLEENGEKYPPVHFVSLTEERKFLEIAKAHLRPENRNGITAPKALISLYARQIVSDAQKSVII